MEYEQTGDAEHPHKLIFRGDETEVVRAAYREHIFNLAVKGNTGSMSDYEAHISGWEEDGSVRCLRPIKPVDVAEVLEEFADRTEEVIQRIPEETGVPAFQSDDIGERHRLGKLAVIIANEIREKSVVEKDAEPLEEVSPELDVDAVQRFLNGEED